MSPRDRIVEIERVWTSSLRKLAETIAAIDPSWGTQVADVGDGVAIFCGQGLYVNRLLGAGLDIDPVPADLDAAESLAADVGVSPAVEICDATRPGLETMLLSRGYVEHGRTTAVAHDLVKVPAPAADVVVEFGGADGLSLWQETAAAGWGHDSGMHRRASDVFAAAASRVDDPGLMIARAADDGRVLACATLRIDDGIATLGGMSTLPAERGKGVQAALIHHRLRLARDAGCRYATSSAETGSASERNLLRHGFTASHTKVGYAGS